MIAYLEHSGYINLETEMLFFKGVKFTDKEIIEGLQEDPYLEDAILKYLYNNHYPKIRKYVISKGGNNAEAKDIFQDSIIVFYQKVKAKKFRQEAKISTYLITLARNMWINRKKRLAKIDTPDSLNLQIDNNQPIDQLMEMERNEFAQKLLQELEEDCRKILTLSIFRKLPMKKISEIMEYQNEQVARNKKSKCLKYLKKAIRKSANLSNIFKELK